MLGRRMPELGVVVCALLVSACGASPDQDPRDAEGSDPQRASAEVVLESSAARSLLDRIRAYGKPPAAPIASAVTSLSPLRKGVNARFTREGSRLRPELGDTLGAKSLDVVLPARADGALELRHPSSGLAVAARVRGARAVEAQISDGLVIYPGGGNHGETLIQRVGSEGTEDYFAFEQAPPVAEVSYDLELGHGVIGLRLVSNTLEFVDASGAPQLRVAPPYLVDAKGEEYSAELGVDGCRVDRDPAPPWDRAPTPPEASRCTVTVRWDGAAVTYPAVLDPAWTATGSMSTARAQHVAVLLNTGRVLVAGGTNAAGNSTLRTAEVFDPGTRTWAATGQMATARAQHTATLRNNGSVAVVGGWNLSTAHRTAESFNPNAGTWSSLGQMQTARRRHTATLLQDGTLLVTGGRANSSALASAERLSTANAWTLTGNMLSAQEGHTATALSTGRVLIVGPNAPTGQLYNPATGAFTATAVAPQARQFHTANTIPDGSVIVAGGANGVKSVERYDPNTDAWSRVGSSSYDHSAHSGLRLPNGRLAIIGGPTSTTRTAVEIFDPTWGTWVPGVPVITARSAHAAAALNDGKILVAGGIPAGTTTATATAELYDPSGSDVTVREYRFPASLDPDVIDDRQTEIWASLHRPSALASGRRYPLLVFLHGNHATCGTGANPRIDNDCSYTVTGTCPSGYSVINNHRGYDYTANELAARGYFVVSINANRGITCGDAYPGDIGVNLPRGRLILKHLQKLSAWDRGAEPTPSSLGVSLVNRIDFSEVGMMGHSRGGEGVRAAYQQYRDPGSPWPFRIGPVNFRGIFEIGPVDGQTNRVLNAEETRWTVLLPACDGDVGSLEGVRPFDRMLAIPESSPFFKSTLHQWGANHNYYNTEWQQSDAYDCANHRPMFSTAEGVTGSAEQRQTGLFSMLSFFTANVGATRDVAANAIFDPQFSYAPENPANRGYHPGGSTAESLVLEDFLAETGTSSYGFPNDMSNVSMFHGGFFPHAYDMPGARIDWTSGGPSTYFQSNFAAVGGGLDLRSYQFLDLRVDRAYFGPTVEDTAFTVRLVNADDTLSDPVSITDYVKLPIPPRYTPVLQTARIPLARFASANLAAVRAVRLTITTGETSGIYLAHIRATRSTTSLTASLAAMTPVSGVSSPLLPQRSAAVAARQRVAGGAVESIRSAGADSVEIVLSSSARFQPKSQLLVLAIGGEESRRSSYAGGDLTRVKFVLSRAAWDRLAGGEPLTVRYGTDGSPAEWSFGPLDKSRLDR